MAPSHPLDLDVNQPWILLTLSLIVFVVFIIAIVQCMMCKTIANAISMKLNPSGAAKSTYKSLEGFDKGQQSDKSETPKKHKTPTKSDISEKKRAKLKFPVVRTDSLKKKHNALKESLRSKLEHAKEKSDDKNKDTLGSINIAFLRSENDVLNVSIVCARDLPAKDVNGLSDPYCRLLMLPLSNRKIDTKVIEKNLSPTWNETIAFPLTYMDLQKQTLYVYVLDHDNVGSDDPIGQVCIELKSLNVTQRDVNMWLELEPFTGYASHLGEILIAICYVPSQEILIVNILKAKHLISMDRNGYSDPFVKIDRICDNQKVERKRTKIVWKNLNPVFNESFQFNVPMVQLDKTSFIFHVVDYDKMSKNDSIGFVVLGEKAGKVANRHWRNMTEHMHQPVACWHKLQPTADVS